MAIYKVDVFMIPINHTLIPVKNGYPEAQDYIFEWGLIPETLQSREGELRQVSSSSTDCSMVLARSAETGSGSRSTVPNKKSRGTRGRYARSRRGHNARTTSGSDQVTGAYKEYGTCSTALQRREGTDRG